MGAPERLAALVWMDYRGRLDREGQGEPTELKGVKDPQESRAQPGRGVIPEHRGLRARLVLRARLELKPSRPRSG